MPWNDNSGNGDEPPKANGGPWGSGGSGGGGNGGSALMSIGYGQGEGKPGPLTVKLKQGTMVWPSEGKPVTMCTSHCGNEIIEAVIVALSQATPERAMGDRGLRRKDHGRALQVRQGAQRLMVGGVLVDLPGKSAIYFQVIEFYIL